MDLDTVRQPRRSGRLGQRADAGPLVTALYQAHGVGLIRLAVVMLGDRQAAEDVVQEAFCGLYRRWDHLDDPQNALPYVRSSVLNGCRSVLRNQSRWAGWATPLIAAAAVTAVIAGVLTVSKLAFHPPSPRASNAGLGTVPLRRAPAAANGAIPPYVVGLALGPLTAQSTRAVVRATASGTALAILSPPRGYSSFTWITGAADDRTFVLAAYAPGPASGSGPAALAGTGSTGFFLLRLDPAAGTARLSPLPVPAQPDVPGKGSPVSGIALAPDGGELAVALGDQSERSELKLFDLLSGPARVWHGARGGGSAAADELGANALSWTADGRILAVDQWVGLTINVRLLDTRAAGGDLWSGRRAATFPNWPSGSAAGSAIISPDGTKIIATAVTRHATQVEVREFSAGTGRYLGSLVRLRYRPGAITGWPNVLWSGSSAAR